jgi:hypothetical protein
MKDTFAFLFATRFWAMALAALSVYGKMKGWLGDPETVLIASIATGFTLVRTIDRASEQNIIASAVGSGQLSNADVAATPGVTTEPIKKTLATEVSESDQLTPLDPELALAINQAVAQAVEIALARAGQNRPFTILS